jgi:hypothetical protein
VTNDDWLGRSLEEASVEVKSLPAWVVELAGTLQIASGVKHTGAPLQSVPIEQHDKNLVTMR